MAIDRRIVIAGIGLALSSPALAADIVQNVDAASGPWDASANQKLMPYGQGDEKPPTVVKFDFAAGKVAIIADGTTTIAGHTGVEPSGVANKAVDDTLVHKKRYPSFYAPKILYPVNEHALIAAFVDDHGVVVGRPFAVGNGVRVPLPDGATAVALGFNDVSFKGNSGSLKVTVETPD